MSPSSKESPRAYRFDAGLPALARCGSSEFPCVAHNLSRTGALLVGEVAWPRMEEVDVLLRSPAGDRQVQVRARVARIEDDPDGDGTCLGVQFIDLDAAQTDSIEVLLKRVIEGHALAPPIQEIPPGTPPHAVRKILDEIPLPHRVTLASRGAPRERETLLQDHQPQVLESLARNPSLLLHEAHALAGLRHLLPSTLTILASDSRWAADEEMKILIVSHPRVTVPLAEKLMADMKLPALRRALQKPGLNPLVRTLILRRISRAAS